MGETDCMGMVRLALSRPPPMRVVFRVVGALAFMGILLSLVLLKDDIVSFPSDWDEGARRIKEAAGFGGRLERTQRQLRNTPIELALQDLFQPNIISPTAPRVQALDGSVHTLSSTDPMPFPTSLGKRLCLVDMDGRSFDGKDEVFSDEPMDMQKQQGTSFSSGIINHFMYANIHNYTYKYIRTAPPPKERGIVWMEISANLEIMENSDCEILVNADADVLFTHLELPLEWLFNRWKFTDQYHVVQSIDPNEDIPEKDARENMYYFRDDFGVTWGNPGFIIMKNTPLMREMLKTWWDCPDNEEKYPGCRKWITGWPGEMGALGNHIRYDERFKNAILELPCTEANGHPDYNGADRIPCKGQWVRHYAGHDDHLYSGFIESTIRGFANVLHSEMAGRKKDLIQDQGKINITTT